jgi:hypothetical protein
MVVDDPILVLELKKIEKSVNAEASRLSNAELELP